ncbi:hypothetical protein IWW48_000245 [Coemansia sp. RSA 1200]|nr:hypothetical protein IWW48_000245 [Coemansia sp. RSA 1200]
MTKAASLYRRLLRVHRLLPREIRFVGDQYVRAEFRNHRSVTDQRLLDQFFKQWTMYLETMEHTAMKNKKKGNNNNISGGGASWDVGKHLDRETVESLDDDKAEQLLDLHRASTGGSGGGGSTGGDDNGRETGGSTAMPPRRK